MTAWMAWLGIFGLWLCHLVYWYLLCPHAFPSCTNRIGGYVGLVETSDVAVMLVSWTSLFQISIRCRCRFMPVALGLVWEMEDSSGWKRIEGDFGKFWLIVEIPPPQCLSFPFIPLIPKQALSILHTVVAKVCRTLQKDSYNTSSSRGTFFFTTNISFIT
jgi:hypothetical protein